jgi:hypothetical protein
MAQANPITTATGVGVSRGRSTKSTSLRLAHTEPAANSTHLDCLDNAFFSDAAQQIPGCSLNRKHLKKLFVDLQSGAVAVIRNAPEDLRSHENWKAS